MMMKRLSITQNQLAITWTSSQPGQRSTGAIACKVFFVHTNFLRIADEMKPEGSFYAETESGNLVDYKPARPVINRLVE